MGKYFGTDGMRGKAGEELLSTHAYKIGRFLGWYFKKTGKRARAVIGKDTRLSSYMLEYAMASGLSSSGADVFMMHVTTTPSISYTVVHDNFDIGIMISASHNPFYDNGIKIINSSGEKIDDSLIEKIEYYIDNETTEKGDIPFASGKDVGKITDYSEGRNRYIAYLISSSKRSFKGLKIGLDPSNGGGFMICRSVFDALGAKTYLINDEPSGENINKKCGSTSIEALSEFVRLNSLDMGFAYDGDADRCIAVDENGKVVDGDKILYILGKNLKSRGELNENTIVTTVMSNSGLYASLGEIGISYKETRVGDRYVHEEMIKNDFSLGGEQSGHIIISKYAQTGDGILTSIKLTECVIEEKSRLSKLASEVILYPQALKNVHVTDKNEVLSSSEVQKAIESARLHFSHTNGRVLVRPSGTEPLIRIMVEGENEELCQKIADELENAVMTVSKRRAVTSFEGA
ncbi:MAG: phosphoglucosamine mutase [Ruminococcaceae bacterium]|nr:phosphoglucosamine mutase [Oscillospiraceae bacterium]